MDHFHWPPNVGQIVLALIVMIGQIYSTIEKRRARRDDRLDRAREKAERDESTRRLFEAQQTAAQSLAQLTEMRTKQVAAKLDEVHSDLQANTEVSREAFREANNFNSKFQALAEADKERTLAGRFQEILIENSNEDRLRALEEKVQVQKVMIEQPPDKPVPVQDLQNKQGRG